ncbi:MAG: DUF192 domain-containing protein [Rhodospirillaceae bacterium]|nr:DUF192 domain-containing protein [Rhodospirillaceae bacterium]MBT5752223.1 DUF192 domain-containing protein [Rhodospirillaceae bacterium]
MRFPVLVLLLLFCPFSVDAGDALSLQPSKLTIESSSGDHDFVIELARSPEERSHGLMFRQHLAEDHGMLFLFDGEKRRAMWMKNTLIPLDMLFLGCGGEVLAIHANATPKSLKPIAPKVLACAVLEIDGGVAAQLGISPGDHVRHPALRD